MTEADRATYGAPEWLEFDFPEFLKQPVDMLERFEDETGMTIVEFDRQLVRASTRGIRALLFAAALMAGLAVRWETFKPSVWLVDRDEPEGADVEGADADPPVPANRAARRRATKTARPSGS